MNDNESIRVKDSQYCLLCGDEGKILYSDQRDRLFGAPGIWSLMQCSRCQLVWLNPQPISDNIGKLYANYFTHKTPNTNRNRNGELRKAVKVSILESRYGYRMDGSNWIIGSFLGRIGPLRELVGGSVRWLEANEKGCLLDVGCGNGAYIDQMRQLGWDVTGVEPDEEAASIAIESGLPVFRGSLMDAKFPTEHFDAITMNHVIEHVANPVELLKECHRVLKLGGRMMVTTPNIKSLGHYVFGEHWRGLEIPRHLTLFSPEALRICAESVGLEISELRTTARIASGMWAASSLIRQDRILPGSSPEETSLWMKIQGLGFLIREHGIFGPRGAGEEIVMTVDR